MKNQLERKTRLLEEQSITKVGKQCHAAGPSPELDKFRPRSHKIQYPLQYYPPITIMFLPSGLFPSVAPTQNLNAFIILRTRATCPACSILLSVIIPSYITRILHLYQFIFSVPQQASRSFIVLTNTYYVLSHTEQRHCRMYGYFARVLSKYSPQRKKNKDSRSQKDLNVTDRPRQWQ